MSETTTEEKAVVCGECGAPMRLLQTQKFKYPDGTPRQFYGCTRWPDCHGTHGAHRNGEPLGVPSDKATKDWRIKAHDAFDWLWKSGLMQRPAAYHWLAGMLGADEVHFGSMTIEECKRAIRVVRGCGVRL